MRQPLDKLIRALGYRFSQPQLLEQALTHRSVGGDNYERLEFLGDAVLGFIIGEELYRRFGQADEGSLSRLRASLVKGETLAALARQLALGDYLRLGPGELKSGGFRRESILADALEAIIGAVYLDGGMEPAKRLVSALFQQRLAAASPKKVQKDPKTRLQELLQGKGRPLPTYEVISVEGEAHDQTFRVRCVVEGIEEENIGVGTSRRKAEQAAAARVLDTLENEQND